MLRPYLIVKDVEPLDGGLSNRCMKVTDENGNSYVWRPNGPSTRAFGLNRADEFEVLTLASEAGFSTSPTSLVQGGLLNPWVEGNTMETPEFDVILDLLVKVHQLPKMSFHFDPFEKGAYYYSQLSPSSRDRSIADIHTYFQSHAFVTGLPLTTCHYDLGYYNVIRKPDGQISLIDWEYAALGDPAMDIVMTSLANEFDLETLVESYCQTKGIEEKSLWLEHCRRWQPVADYLGLLWYALGYELYGDELYEERKRFFQSKLQEHIRNNP
ncbi:thiamine kinase [Enterovibrio coralii]|uniref:Thiamine kinase n=2 Tax=Enterovibrio coralii TaxID=294935 RepID=A0A135I9D1_9GAMM|nr:thiamine kinase [Enterovibrio coralii]